MAGGSVANLGRKWTLYNKQLSNYYEVNYNEIWCLLLISSSSEIECSNLTLQYGTYLQPVPLSNKLFNGYLASIPT